MKMNLNHHLAEVTTSALKTVLTVSANTNSCTLIHQPKAPASLSNFSKVK